MEDMDIVSVMLIEGVCVNAGDSTEVACDGPNQN